MAAVLHAICPRCDEAFRCGVADAAGCACTTIALDAGTLARLRERYRGCLCFRCLREVGEDRLSSHPASKENEMPKGVQRSNKETKKPKKDKAPSKPVTPSPPMTTVVPDRHRKKEA